MSNYNSSFVDIVNEMMFGSKDRSEKAVLAYFHGDELATKVYKEKYETYSDSRNPKSTPQSMIHRICSRLAGIEKEYPNSISYEEIFELLSNFKYVIPGGSVLFGLNNPDTLVSLSNCFVIGEKGEKDSYGAIMKRDEEQIQLMKRRGGVGQDLSFIRPAGSKVRNAAKTSTGIVPFAERFSNSIKEVAQDGRRGAGMLTIDFSHRDALAFINAKANTDKITGANISVKMDDRQLSRISRNLDGFITQGGAQRLVANNGLLEIQNDDDIEEVFQEAELEKFRVLIKNARDFSEPGILFWDRINEQLDGSIYRNTFGPISTNPCGELPLSGDEACRLLSLVLYSYVEHPYTENANFDFVKFENHVYIAQKLMDDIVDLEIQRIDDILYSLNQEFDNDKNLIGRSDTLRTEINLWLRILKKAKDGRRTGLGYTALADAIAALGMIFGSKESIDFAEEVTKTLMKGSYKSSIHMAKERGPFKAYKSNEFHYDSAQIRKIKLLFYDEPEVLDMWRLSGRRNIQNLAIAPTGTISLLARTSSGIEPVFSLKYKRRKRSETEPTDGLTIVKDENGELWEEFNVIHPGLQRWYNANYEKPINLANLKTDSFNELIKKSPYYRACAHEINPLDKITMHGMIQKWIDSSISNTLNLPEDVTEEQIFRYALYAWEIGVKGFTIYREGSRGGILISKKEENKLKPFSQNDAVKRPKYLDCDVNLINIEGTEWVVLIGLINDKPYEIFAFKGGKKLSSKDFSKLKFSLRKVKSGHYDLITKDIHHLIVSNINDHFEKPQEEFITRLISTALRHGTDVRFLHDQLTKSNGIVSNFHQAMARVLKKYIKVSEKINEHCPECNSTLTYESGCIECKSCGYSKC